MPAPEAPPALSSEDRKALIDRLARVEGQLRGVQRMIAEERDCEAIAQQLSAARGALSRAFTELIACAIEHRLASEPPDELHERLSGILGLLNRYG